MSLAIVIVNIIRLLYYYLDSRTRMSRYVSWRHNTHTSTYESDEFCYWKL